MGRVGHAHHRLKPVLAAEGEKIIGLGIKESHCEGGISHDKLPGFPWSAHNSGIQPQTQRHDRSLDELLGLAKGMAADGVINQLEAEFLHKWLVKNNDLNSTWPVNVINERVRHMLCDGVLDQEEQQELFGLICSFTGQIPVEQELENMSSSLPLDDPPPSLTFNGSVYCFHRQLRLGYSDGLPPSYYQTGWRDKNFRI